LDRGLLIRIRGRPRTKLTATDQLQNENGLKSM
jgi:hypothetical protein